MSKNCIIDLKIFQIHKVNSEHTAGNRFNDGRQNVLIDDFSTGNLINLIKYFNAIKMM